MGFYRLQLQFVYQGFQLKGVQLLFAVFVDVVVQIVDQGPGNDHQAVFGRHGSQPGRKIGVFQGGGQVQDIYQEYADQAAGDTGQEYPDQELGQRLFYRQLDPSPPTDDLAENMCADKTGCSEDKRIIDQLIRDLLLE